MRDDPDKLTDFLHFGGSPTEEVLRKELSHHHQDKFSGKFVDVWNEDRQKVSTFKEGNQQYKHMDLNDILAVRIYTGNSIYRPFNEAMRAMLVEHQPPEIWQSMYYHTLNGVTHLNGVDHGEVLYRGEKELNSWQKGSDFHKDYEVGNVVKWRAFTSTTTKRAVAEGFAGSTGALFIINDVAKNLGARLSDRLLSKHENESEVLLPAGVSLRVTGTNQEEGGRYEVHLEYLQCPSDLIKGLRNSQERSIQALSERHKKDIARLRKQHEYDLEQQATELQHESGHPKLEMHSLQAPSLYSDPGPEPEPEPEPTSAMRVAHVPTHRVQYVTLSGGWLGVVVNNP